MPRRPEPFVYRRSDESLHWALGQVMPPSLQGALQGEKAEKRNENLRLLYVACTRAMELLVIPDFTWSDDTSWVKQLDLRLGEVPELNVMHLPRGTFTAPVAIDNQQSAPVFAEERLRLDHAFDHIRWIRPSDSDPDVVPIEFPASVGDNEPLQPPAAIEGGRLRGVILHKLMEELLTGELDAVTDAAQERARLLRDQLASAAAPSTSLDPEELASTALRTLALPELESFRNQLIPEVPIYGTASNGIDELIAGRADAIAWAEDGSNVVFDWKSDVAPKDTERAAYAQQLGQYLHVFGAKRGGVVYMTSGHIDWISAPPLYSTSVETRIAG
jgi:CRISPR-associated exonuclease Cas4